MILTRLLPIAVEIKNTQKLIYKWPQVRPAKSNKGLGIEANNKTVINECLLTWSKIHSFIFDNFPSVSFKSSISYPFIEADLATKYGGSSPMAVPNPHKNPSIQMVVKIVRKLTEAPSAEQWNDGLIENRCGFIWTIFWHSWEAITNFVIFGPKYNTNVCRPVPRPIDDNIPSPIQKAANKIN